MKPKFTTSSLITLNNSFGGHSSALDPWMFQAPILDRAIAKRFEAHHFFFHDVKNNVSQLTSGDGIVAFKNSTYPQIMSKVQKITLTTCLKAPLATQMESVRSCGGEGIVMAVMGHLLL